MAVCCLNILNSKGIADIFGYPLFFWSIKVIDFSETRLDLARHYRWLVVLSNTLDWSESNCGTACTDGKSVWFDPSFWGQLDRPERLAIIMHEIMHIVKKHHKIRSIDGKKPNHDRLNRACDYVLNLQLFKDFKRLNRKHRRIVAQLPDDVLLDWKYDGLTELEVYRLLESQESEPENQDSDQGENGQENKEDNNDENQGDDNTGESSGEDGQSNEGDSGQNGPELPQQPKNQIGGFLPSDDEGDELDQTIQKSIQIAEQAGQGGGLLADIVKQYAAPQIDYTYHLRNFYTGSAKRQLSWKELSRPHDLIGLQLPSQQKSIPEINIYVDFSYSISDEMINKFLVENNSLANQTKPEKINFFGFHDTVFFIESIQTGEFQPVKKIKRGGTDFQAVVDHFNDHSAKLAIVLTDGHSWVSTPANKPAIWFSTQRLDFGVSENVFKID